VHAPVRALPILAQASVTREHDGFALFLLLRDMDALSIATPVLLSSSEYRMLAPDVRNRKTNQHRRFREYAARPRHLDKWIRNSR